MGVESRHKLVDRALLAAPTVLGLLLGALAFVAALTPSLIPRNQWLQGVVAGIAFAAGYGVGAGLVAFGRLMGTLPAEGAGLRRLKRGGLVVAAILALTGAALAPDWQNGIRAAMGMGPVERFHPALILVVAAIVGTLLILLGRLFRRVWILLSNMLLVVLPVRAALLAGFLVACLLAWGLGSGVIARNLVAALDKTYEELDDLIPPGTQPPADPLKSGSVASLVSWRSLGAQGRDYISQGPDRQAIAALTGAEAREPIRVYIGLNAADDPAGRAQLALAELKRAGAFDRGHLVVATPTGTGWVDPAGSAPLEYLLRGDVATVAVQYSYLPSWLSLLVEPERGAETARHVFRAIYAHWASLPAGSRPKLYLFGLSLGSLNSDLSVDLYDILAAPHDGAFWVGPPFRSRTWNIVVSAREHGTSVWRPRYREGRMFRFTTQENLLSVGDARWGPLRIVYLQYPSDPIVFFETGSALREPRIAQAPRAPDLSPGFTWIPAVTFLQMVVDMMTATTTPRGFGHVYAASHYIDGWLALLEPSGWPPEAVERLRARLNEQGL